MRGRIGVGCAVAVVTVGVVAAPAMACGGLVGENGTIQLVRTATLAAYHDGVERYVTSFEFIGEGEEVGSIVPLPDVPTKVERGGDWTLQRLEREVAPPVEERAVALAAVGRGGQRRGAARDEDRRARHHHPPGRRRRGRPVGARARLPPEPDAPEMLDFYAARSPIFMAARFDAARAADLGQQTGDGTPIMLTIPTDEPWVPLRILASASTRARGVEADVFLLTDDKPEAPRRRTRAPASSAASRRARACCRDLRSDKGMEWVPDQMWFTYLRVQAPAGDLDYDLAASTRPNESPSLTDAGITAPEAHPVTAASTASPIWPVVAGVGVAIAAYVAFRSVPRLRTSRRAS